MDLALVSCTNLPEPDPDAAPLSEALASAGIEAAVRAWDDPGVDWAEARLTLLRSSWNYPQDPRGFMAWAQTAARLSRLWNPLPVVRWNVHKGYLIELAGAGLPVTPTVLVRQGSGASLAAILAEQGWHRVVIKPAISAGSYLTIRADTTTLDRGEAHLRDLAAVRDVLVQPYLTSVEDHGERAVVWIDGELTHAVRKSPRLSGDHESVSAAVPISNAERDLALRAIEAVEGPLLYARVDMAPGPRGEPLVMELELIEPSLFFAQGPRALERLVQAVRRRVANP